MPKSKAERRRKKSVHKKTHPKVPRKLNSAGQYAGEGDDGRRRFPLHQQVKARGGTVNLHTRKTRARAKAIRQKAKQRRIK